VVPERRNVHAEPFRQRVTVGIGGRAVSDFRTVLDQRVQPLRHECRANLRDGFLIYSFAPCVLRHASALPTDFFATSRPAAATSMS
jgi:hypothetical protein